LGERVLSTLLGEIPVAGHADQRGDDLAPLRLERVGQSGLYVYCHACQNGRTSIAPK